MVKDRRPGPGMPVLNNDTCAEGGSYLFMLGSFSMYDAIHGWMTRWTDGWMDGSRDAIHGWMMGRMDGWTGHVKKLHENMHQYPS